MKSIFVITFALFAFFGTAQVNPHAIGLRGLIGNYGSGGEISYQHGLGDANRLELDLGWRTNRWWNNKNKDLYRNTAITGVYHWVFNLDQGVNWYVGPGAQLGWFYYRDYEYITNDGAYVYKDDRGASLSVGGQIGIEYDFNTNGAPLLISLDARPMWNFIGYYSDFGYGVALSLRYTF